MGLLESIEQTAFLGEEFLTWLWFRSETAPKIGLGEPRGEVKIEMGDPLVLRGSEDQDATQVTVRGERAAASAEARAALLEGKKLWKCKVIFKQGELAWPCSLNSDSLGIGTLGLPVPKGVPMPDGLILRAEKLEEFTQIYFAVFEQFLDLRLREKNWHKLEAAMHEWVTGSQ